MLSVIICSKYKVLPADLLQNITDTIGIEHEIIHIDNSSNAYSIFSAYNTGIGRSKYPHLCFLHEDVFFHSEGWGKNIVAHLHRPQVGFCGIAGRNFVPQVPAAWNNKLQAINIIQSDKTGRSRTKTKLNPKNNRESILEVITLDGVILCVNKDLFKEISFDEQISSFHGYDIDICLQAYTKGYHNFVIYDILLEHFSKGNPDVNYYRALIKTFKKWENNLPASVHKISTKKVKQINYRGLSKLTGKMVRRQMTNSEIKTEISYFADKLHLKFPKLRKICIYPEIILFKCQYFFSKHYNKKVRRHK